MAKAGTITIDMELASAKFNKELDKATKQLNQSTKQMSKQMSGMQKSFRQIGNAAKIALGGLVVAAATKAASSVISTADAMTMMEAKIKNVTSSSAEFKQVFDEIVASSSRSRQSIEGTAQAFVRLKPAAQELGVTNQQLIQFTETFSKMGTLSGATAVEVQNAMIQMSQGLASGTLRGDELRSVMEQMPTVARTIADSMGIPFKEFKDAAQDGLITAEEVFKAIMDKTDEVNAQFEKMPVTVETGMQEIGKSLQLLVNEINKVIGANQSFADALMMVSEFLNKHRQDIANVIVFIAQMAETTIQAGKMVVGALGAMVNVSAGLYIKIVSMALHNIQNLANQTIDSINKVIQAVNLIPKIDIPQIGKFKMPGIGAVDGAMNASFRDAKMFANWFTSAGKDIFSGKSAFKYAGGGSGLTKALGGSLGADAFGAGAGDSIESGGGKAGKKAGKKAGDEFKIGFSESMTDIGEHVHAAFEKIYGGGMQQTLDQMKQSVASFGEESNLWLHEIQNNADKTAEAWSWYADQMERGHEKEIAMAQAQEHVNQLLSQKAITLDQAAVAMDKYKESLNETTNTSTAMTQALGNWFSNFGNGVFDVFVNSLETGKFAFKDFVASALKDLGRLIFQLLVIQPLIRGLFGEDGKGGLVGGFISSFVGGLFGGGKAVGGPVNSGTTYLVGEKGPELFTPGASGAITPNHKLAGAMGGGGVQVVQHFHISTGVQQTVRAEIERMRPQMKRDAIDGVHEAIRKGGTMAKAVGNKS